MTHTTVWQYITTGIVVVATTVLGVTGRLSSEAVAGLLGAALMGPTAYAVGKVNGRST